MWSVKAHIEDEEEDMANKVYFCVYAGCMRIAHGCKIRSSGKRKLGDNAKSVHAVHHTHTHTHTQNEKKSQEKRRNIE